MSNLFINKFEKCCHSGIVLAGIHCFYSLNYKLQFLSTLSAIALLLGMSQHLYATESNALPLYLQLVQQAKADKHSFQEAEKLLKNYKKTDLINDLAVSPFHKRSPQSAELKNSFCQGCHSQWPHKKQLRTRAMLNKHSSIIACETCHLKPENRQLTYAWWNIDSQSSAPAGTNGFTLNQDNDTSAANNAKLQIIPIYQSQPALIFRDHSFARTALKKWDELMQSPTESVKEKSGQHIKLHMPLNKDKTNCRSCHQQKQPLLDLNALGATDKQIKAIENNPIANFFERYKEDDERIQIIEMLR